MSDRNTRTDNVQGDAERPSAKLPYAKPVLRIFGTVTDLTRGSGGSRVDGRMVNKAAMSDRRTKTNLVQVDSHPLGFGLYLFDYKPEFRDEFGHGRQFGVMADEVKKVMPSAITPNTDGYNRINYEHLGIFLRSRRCRGTIARVFYYFPKFGRRQE